MCLQTAELTTFCNYLNCFKSMWAGPLSTASVINNCLPGCCVYKLSSFYHLYHPRLLPSQARATSPRTSKFISQTLLGCRSEERGITVFTYVRSVNSNQFLSCCVLGHAGTKLQSVFKLEVLALRCSAKIKRLELQKS